MDSSLGMMVKTKPFWVEVQMAEIDEKVGRPGLTERLRQLITLFAAMVVKRAPQKT